MAVKQLYPWQTEEGKKEFNQTDGLDVYDEDYTNPTPLPNGYTRPGQQSDGTIAFKPNKSIDTNADALSVESIDNTENKKATDAAKIFKEMSKIESAVRNFSATGDGRIIALPMPNVLMPYASHSYKLGLYSLSDHELNNPDETYRINYPKVAVLQSGGGLGDKKVTTAYEINGKRIEFFIDNLEIETIISPTKKKGVTNAVGFRFEVHEPYSMGLFLQALQIAALEAGHKNYTESPFLLTIDFVGWKQDGTPYSVPESKRMLPFKLVGSELAINGGGSTYTVEGVAYNDVVLTDQVQRLPVDVSIKGRTIQSMMQSGPGSLSAALNLHHTKKAIDDKVLTADQYFITFPKTRATKGNSKPLDSETKGANEQSEVGTGNTITSSLNENKKTKEEYEMLWHAVTNAGKISREALEYVREKLSSLVSKTSIGQEIEKKQTGEQNSNNIGNATVFDPEAFGVTNQPYGLAGFTWDEENQIWNRDSGQLKIDPALGELKFTKGTRIQDVISEIIIISDYGKKIVGAPSDENGFKEWFRIDTQVFQISDNDTEDQIGRKPRIYVFRVLPYKVHESRFIAPSANAAGVRHLKKQVCKKYDYIYSGANDDILDLQLNMDNTFFKSISPGNYPKTSGQESASSDQEKKDALQTETGNKETLGGEGGPTGDSDMQSTVALSTGAVSPDDAKIDIARRFNEAIVNSDVDMLTVDMTIWGDPYYIADSGIGNYNSENTEFINLSSDGTIDYQNGEVDVEVNFRTPIDIRDNGIMGFPSDQVAVNQFSGLYQVIKVMNTFAGGQFKQVLELIRRSNQRPEAETDQSDKTSTKITNEEKKIQGQKPKEFDKSLIVVDADLIDEYLKNASPEALVTAGVDVSQIRTTKKVGLPVHVYESLVTEGGTEIARKRLNNSGNTDI